MRLSVRASSSLVVASNGLQTRRTEHSDGSTTTVWSLRTPAGSTAQRGDEPPQTFNHTNVKLISPGAWWTAIWNDGRRYDLDFLVADQRDGFLVLQALVHSIDGKKRAYHLEETQTEIDFRIQHY